MLPFSLLILYLHCEKINMIQKEAEGGWLKRRNHAPFSLTIIYLNCSGPKCWLADSSWCCLECPKNGSKKSVECPTAAPNPNIRAACHSKLPGSSYSTLQVLSWRAASASPTPETSASLPWLWCVCDTKGTEDFPALKINKEIKNYF